MSTEIDRHAVHGIEVHFDPAGGRIAELAIEQEGETAALCPLHKAPWVASGETLMVWMPPQKGITMCRGDVAVTSQK